LQHLMAIVLHRLSDAPKCLKNVQDYQVYKK
jgi:hypothetical protein